MEAGAVSVCLHHGGSPGPEAQGGGYREDSGGYRWAAGMNVLPAT